VHFGAARIYVEVQKNFRKRWLRFFCAENRIKFLIPSRSICAFIV